MNSEEKVAEMREAEKVAVFEDLRSRALEAANEASKLFEQGKKLEMQGMSSSAGMYYKNAEARLQWGQGYAAVASLYRP